MTKNGGSFYLSEKKEVMSEGDKVDGIVIPTPKTLTKEDSKMSLEDCLKPLEEVDGYMASAIFDINGEILAKHSIVKLDLDAFAAIASGMARDGMRGVEEAGLGTGQFLQANADKGILAISWIEENETIAGFILKPDANLGLAKRNLAKVVQLAAKEL